MDREQPGNVGNVGISMGRTKGIPEALKVTIAFVSVRIYNREKSKSANPKLT